MPYEDFANYLRTRWKEGGWLKKIVITIDELYDLNKDIDYYLADDSDIITYDNYKIVVAKYWGGVDIEKLKKISPDYEYKVKNKSD